MIDSNEYKDQENKESDTALVPSELHILVTDADTNGYEISKMSDFMGLYAQQLTRSLADSPFVEVISNIPVADLGIINDVVQHAAVVARGNITLVPDFDSLPAGIKEKLKQGLYSIGDSKQVDGNLRAVIVDENGVRVKDITLKKVINNPGTLETTRSIANQMQMKQIQDTLKGIQEMQSYQLDRDRDRDILTPFFDARDYILQAQNATSVESRNQFLEKASDRMTTALNSVYAEMRTASLHLAKNTKRSLFHKQSSIDTLLSNLSDDLQLATKFSGVQMQVFEALGRREDSKLVLDRYQTVMHDFITQEIGGRGMSAIDLMHDNYHYSKENTDCWYTFSKELEPALESTRFAIENKDVYIVSVEDVNDEKNNNEERKCKMCGKTIVGKNKTGICSACKKKAGDTGVTVMGVLALIGGAIWTGVKAFTKKD